MRWRRPRSAPRWPCGPSAMLVASSPATPVAARVNSAAEAPAGIDERRLVAAARAGDRDAYGCLLERHLAVAFRAAYLVTGSAAEAEDALQEASVKAWLALARFRPTEPFRP